MENVTRIVDRMPFVPAPVRHIDHTPAPACNVQHRRFMTTAELAGRMGLGDLSRRTAMDRLRVLHIQGGMPLPRSPRVVAGKLKTGAASIHWGSLFDRGEMLAWIEDGYCRPGGGSNSPETTPSRQRHVREQLASRCVMALPRRRAASR